MPYVPYNKKLKAFSQDLRNKSTLGEVLLWKELRASKMMGYKFNRQKPLANYIVDFYCKSLNLVIEVDGTSHDDKQEEDRIRDERLNKMGLVVLRLNEYEIRDDIEIPLRQIKKFIVEFEAANKISVLNSDPD
jgi:very-short-patch-repair endonuclease